MGEGIARAGREFVKLMKDPVVPCRMIKGHGQGMYKNILTLAVITRSVFVFEQCFGVLKVYLLFRQ
jgi:hypothetical protein